MPSSVVSEIVHPPAPLADHISDDWCLDRTYAFLNHGSFGARLRAIAECQTTLRAQYEARPIEWLGRQANGMIAEGRRVVGAFVGSHPDSLGFTTNATEAINAVLRSLAFKPGDELLTTTHVYNAVRMTMRHVAQRVEATYREIDIPLPVRSPDQIVDAVCQAMNGRTRLIVIDHVTSTTAIVFPAAAVVDQARKRGIDVLIDGAHAPGMLPLDVESIGAAYYAANLHKWTCAPSGAGFLHVRPDRQKGIHPTTVSHFYEQGFIQEFQWQGTRDITPWLCAKESIAYLGRLGWDRVMNHNHSMAVWVQAMLCERWGVEPASPRDGSMLGSMATVEVPGQERLKRKYGTFDAFKAPLFDRFRIEVPVVDWGGKWRVRPCCQIYNTSDQYEQLADAVLTLLDEAP
jgi:isopenicillin-N epimerase